MGDAESKMLAVHKLRLDEGARLGFWEEILGAIIPADQPELRIVLLIVTDSTDFCGDTSSILQLMTAMARRTILVGTHAFRECASSHWIMKFVSPSSIRISSKKNFPVPPPTVLFVQDVLNT